MSKFYPLLKPDEHKDLYNRPVYWVEVEAAKVDPKFNRMFLHNDGKVKDGMMHIGQPMTTCEFVTLDRAYLAINEYYVAHGQLTPFVYMQGSWYVDDVCDDGQTIAGANSQTMVFE